MITTNMCNQSETIMYVTGLIKGLNNKWQYSDTRHEKICPARPICRSVSTRTKYPGRLLIVGLSLLLNVFCVYPGRHEMSEIL